jgi:triosephosphate isomerase
MFFNKKPFIVEKLDFTKPFIVLNFKTYKESTGENAVKLALIAEKVQKKTKVNIIVCVETTYLEEVAKRVMIPVFAQHTDCETLGKSTGHIIPEQLLNINVRGSLLNHSEDKIDIKRIENTVIRLKELDMTSIVCAKSETEAKSIAKFKTIRPTLIAIEPPELIGGETSISQAKPGIIPKAVKVCGNIPVLVGAGIKTNEDLKIALKGGAKGVLLASHFVLAKDPEKFLLDLLKDVK